MGGVTKRRKGEGTGREKMEDKREKGKGVNNGKADGGRVIERRKEIA